MASTVISSTAAAAFASLAQANMVAPFTGLKSASAFAVTKKSNDITSLASNGGRVQCMKVPMFGCTDSSQVLAELEEAKKAHPTGFIRIIGFDNVRQVQVISFIAYKPKGY